MLKKISSTLLLLIYLTGFLPNLLALQNTHCQQPDTQNNTDCCSSVTPPPPSTPPTQNHCTCTQQTPQPQQPQAISLNPTLFFKVCLPQPNPSPKNLTLPSLQKTTQRTLSARLKTSLQTLQKKSSLFPFPPLFIQYHHLSI